MIRLALLLICLANSGIADSLLPAGKVIWENGNEAFGGLSGIEVLPDGRFIAISDRGAFFTGQILRENGEIIAVLSDYSTPILDSKGNALTGTNTDAEGLDIDPEGNIYISFESNHRIMRHSSTGSAGEFIPKHPDFSGLQNNSGLEALAIDHDGVIYAIPERSGKLDRPFPVYRFDGEAWDNKLPIPRLGEYLVVGADFGPDGKLYLLERGFTWLGGFFTRIRRFEIYNDVVIDSETLLETPPGRLDNMEGISVWLDEDYHTRLTIVSDDNFNPLQDTMIAEYVLVVSD